MSDAIKARELVNTAFRTRSYETATDEELRDWLAVLCTETAANERLHPRDIIRGLTINHIQVSRFIDKANRQNTCLAIAIGIITLFSLCASTIQAIAAWHSLHPPATAAQSK